jgi:hypothetical protein
LTEDEAPPQSSLLRGALLGAGATFAIGIPLAAAMMTRAPDRRVAAAVIGVVVLGIALAARRRRSARGSGQDGVAAGLLIGAFIALALLLIGPVLMYALVAGH